MFICMVCTYMHTYVDGDKIAFDVRYVLVPPSPLLKKKKKNRSRKKKVLIIILPTEPEASDHMSLKRGEKKN